MKPHCRLVIIIVIVFTLITISRYAPHVDRNLSLPRVTAEIYNFTGFLNTLGVFVRGGDISINAARYTKSNIIWLPFAFKLLHCVSLCFIHANHHLNWVGLHLLLFLCTGQRSMTIITTLSIYSIQSIIQKVLYKKYYTKSIIQKVLYKSVKACSELQTSCESG